MPSIDYSFFIAGHIYGAPGTHNVGVHPPFKEKFDLIKNDTSIEFGVFTGDIVIEGTKKNWKGIDDDIAELEMPIYFAAGNHDLTNKWLYEKKYGKTYFSFVKNSDLFIILNPNIDSLNISGDQLHFLKKELDIYVNCVNNIFVFFHQLLWWTPDNIYKNVEVNRGIGATRSNNFWDEVEPLFHQLENNVIMFAGDIGATNLGDEFMYHTYDNITFVASGMGGGKRDNIVIIDRYVNDSVGFRLIALNGDNIGALGKLEDYRLKISSEGF